MKKTWQFLSIVVLRTRALVYHKDHHNSTSTWMKSYLLDMTFWSLAITFHSKLCILLLSKVSTLHGIWFGGGGGDAQKRVHNSVIVQQASILIAFQMSILLIKVFPLQVGSHLRHLLTSIFIFHLQTSFWTQFLSSHHKRSEWTSRWHLHDWHNYNQSPCVHTSESICRAKSLYIGLTSPNNVWHF